MFLSNFALKTTVQRVLTNVREVLDYPMLHPGREMQLVALQESVDYLRGLPSLPAAFPSARELMEFALETSQLKGPVVELGVYKGATIRFIAKRVGASRTVHGFDTFRGLPSRWTGNTSLFDAQGQLPDVPSNVELHVGLFEETVPGWAQGQSEPVSFVHFDCDIYESAVSGLEGIASLVAAGTVMVFDEYFNYPGWRDHEFRAFQEFVAKYDVQYEYIGYSRIQMAVRIEEIRSRRSQAT